MSGKLISKLPIDEFLEIDDLAIAISNNDFVITWYNRNFKELAAQSRIKGKSILNIFPEINKEQLTNKNEQFRIPIAENDLTILLNL